MSTEVGAWGGQEFVRVIMRHKMRMQKYPDEKAATGRPYEGIENLRPESVAAVEAFLAKQGAHAKQAPPVRDPLESRRPPRLAGGWPGLRIPPVIPSPFEL